MKLDEGTISVVAPHSKLPLCMIPQCVKEWYEMFKENKIEWYCEEIALSSLKNYGFITDEEKNSYKRMDESTKRAEADREMEDLLRLKHRIDNKLTSHCPNCNYKIN
jgi:hypothetical protein